MASLLSTAEFFRRCDKRVAEDLNSDTGVAITDGAIPTDANLLEAIGDAEGEFTGIVTVFGRYSYADLQTLASGSETPGQDLMFNILTRLTELKIFDRRPDMRPDELPKKYGRAVWLMNAIASGDTLLVS